MQENLKALQTKLSKAQAALDKLHYFTSFNQNVSFAMGKSLQHLSDFTFVQMANLTLLHRDLYLENLKPGVKHDTFSALRNCPLNGHALFLDVVIRKAEDEITQYESTKRTSQPGPGQGGSQVDIKSNNNKPISNYTLLIGNNHRTPPALLARIRLHGSLLVVGADPEDEVGEVSSDAAPTLLRKQHSINDNYCKVKPVPVARSVVGVPNVQRQNFSVTVHPHVLCPVVSPVPFVQERQSQKKDTSPSLKTKGKNKICVSIVDHCFCPKCSHCPQCCSCQTSGRSSSRLLANLVPPGCKSKGSVHIEGWVHPPIQTQTSSGERPVDKQWYANPLRNLYLKEALHALIIKKAVERVTVQTSLAFFNRLFIVPKPNQKWRPILDLSALNIFLSVKTFKMDTPETIQISLQQGERVTLLDFSDVYFHISVHTRSRKFLRFHFQNQTYQFRALPFGLSTAPMEFTCVVKEVKLMAQCRGIRIHQYLDDWLILAPTTESCHQGTQSLLALCQDLVWIVNLQKSELEPKPVFEFVGYQYDLLHRLVKPNQNCCESILQKVSSILPNPTCWVRKFMSLIGLLTAEEKQVPLGRLHMRPIQWHLRRHWRVPESLEKEISVPRSLHPHLQWWTKETNVLQGQPLHPLHHALQVFTDAPKEGWGAH